jgi:hypothetical protein
MVLSNTGDFLQCGDERELMNLVEMRGHWRSAETVGCGRSAWQQASPAEISVTEVELGRCAGHSGRLGARPTRRSRTSYLDACSHGRRIAHCRALQQPYGGQGRESGRHEVRPLASVGARKWQQRRRRMS